MTSADGPVKVAEGPWRIVAVMAIAAVALAFAASAVRRQMPGPVRHERAACNADARAVEVAADAYRATTYVWPANMKALTSASVGSEPYLRAAPSGKHYTMTIGPDGVVLVNGQSYDAGMAGQGPNPCSRIR